MCSDRLEQNCWSELIECTSFGCCVVDGTIDFFLFFSSRRASERARIARSSTRFLRFHDDAAGRAWAYAIRLASAYRRQPEAVPQAVKSARARWLNRAISLPHSLSRYTGRRRRSKPISYGGPLNTGWRVKSVIKIINGSSTRAFPYRRSTARPWGASVKGDNTQRSLLRFALLSPLPLLLFPSCMWSILYFLFFSFYRESRNNREWMKFSRIWKDIDVRDDNFKNFFIEISSVWQNLRKHLRNSLLIWYLIFISERKAVAQITCVDRTYMFCTYEPSKSW